MTASTSKSGFFRRALKVLVEARQREAERYVNGVLLSFDDETLKRHGYSRAELAKRQRKPGLVLTPPFSASGGWSPIRRG